MLDIEDKDIVSLGHRILFAKYSPSLSKIIHSQSIYYPESLSYSIFNTVLTREQGHLKYRNADTI